MRFVAIAAFFIVVVGIFMASFVKVEDGCMVTVKDGVYSIRYTGTDYNHEYTSYEEFETALKEYMEGQE